MSDSPLEPRDELTDRLAALGRQPVDPALQSQHLTAMASVPVARSFRTSLAGRLKVGAGVMAGFLLGASGLTAAGAMGPLQPVAAKVAAEVANADFPQGPKDKAEKAKKAKKDVDGKGSIGTARDWLNTGGDPAGCVAGKDGKFAGNRGQYLKQQRAAGPEALAIAKASTCGMPLGGDDAEEAPEVEDTDEAKGDGGEGQGKENAPGQLKDKDKADDADDDGPGDKAQGPKDDADKPETPAGPKTDDGAEKPAGPPDEAGKSGVEPPVVDPPPPAPSDRVDPPKDDEV